MYCVEMECTVFCGNKETNNLKITNEYSLPRHTIYRFQFAHTSLPVELDPLGGSRTVILTSRGLFGAQLPLTTHVLEKSRATVRVGYLLFCSCSFRGDASYDRGASTFV